MKKIALVIALLPFLAFAGKREREYMKSDVEPAVKAAEEGFKKACGCGLKITLDEKTVVGNEKGMYEAKHIAESIRDSAAGYCTDEPSKKAMCKMTKLTITQGTTTEFKFEGGRGIATTDGNSYVGWDMITQQLDK